MNQPIPKQNQSSNQPDIESHSEDEVSALPNYQIVGTLGSGTFGKVKSAIHLPSGQQVAIKIIDKKTLKDADDRERVEREVQIMKCIRHPNIIQFYEKIETLACIYLVVEYAENGELFKLMAEENRINERAAGRIFIQLMNAVEYLHRLGIAHRDLKPQNILLDTDYNIKLIDFGLSNYSQKGEYLHTACGSPCYAPPEMVSGRSYEGQIGDLWSMGIIFYGMICGNLPFEENTTKQLYKRVIEGVYLIPSYITLQATEAIRKMLVTSPAQRITIPQLRKLTFFKNLRQIQPKIIGIIVGFHPMPIDSEIIEKMRKIVANSGKPSFNREHIEDQIKENEHNEYTTLYYLLQKQSLRNGGKTAIDLQYFLESSQKYKGEYGILPANFEREQSNQTIKTVKQSSNSARNKYNISSTKGLSREKRQPISISKKSKHEKTTNQTYRSEKPESLQKYKQADNLFHTVRRYKLEKAERNQRNTQSKAQPNGRSRHLKTMGSEEKQKSQHKPNKSKQLNNHYSSSTSRKKSQKKVKTQNTQKLALNLWNAYFEKPIETSARYSKQVSSGHGLKLVKKQKQRQDKAFTQNLQRLKQGFLKLPFMKNSKNSDQEKTQEKGQYNHQSERSRNFSKKEHKTII